MSESPAEWAKEASGEAASGGGGGGMAKGIAKDMASGMIRNMLSPSVGGDGDGDDDGDSALVRAVMTSEGGVGVDTAQERFGVGEAGAHTIHGLSMMTEELFGVSGVPAVAHVGYGVVKSVVGRE